MSKVKEAKHNGISRLRATSGEPRATSDDRQAPCDDRRPLLGCSSLLLVSLLSTARTSYENSFLVRVSMYVYKYVSK